MKKIYLISNLLFFVFTISAQNFIEITTNLTNLQDGELVWADFDNDNDLDIIITGAQTSGGGNKTTEIYQNNDGVFTNINAELMGVNGASTDWADYDLDGDLDLIVAGYSGDLESITKIYQNNDGIFNDINAELPGVTTATARWGDYDNDGDPDILLSGFYSEQEYGITRIYKNQNGVFTDIEAGLLGVQSSACRWGDYDNDGDLDILFTGSHYPGGTLATKTIIYQNNNGNFTDIEAELTNIAEGDIQWADYDQDGDLDIALAGTVVEDGSIDYSVNIYRNDDGNFIDIQANIELLFYGAIAWADYDNDGDLDLLISGSTENFGAETYIYNNDNGIFNNSNQTFTALEYSNLSCADYNNDNKLDFIISGENQNVETILFQNQIVTENTLPNAPTNLSIIQNENSVTFTWNKATDNETQQNGLSYNIYIGNISQQGNIMSPLADIETGYRRIVKRGNTNYNNSWTINNLQDGTYFWSVQTIDNSYAGSEFAEEQTFTINTTKIEKLKNQISIYPNPSNGSFTIINCESQITNIEIIDLAGKKTQYSVNNNQYSINKKGVYFIKIKTKNHFFIRKIIIQ